MKGHSKLFTLLIAAVTFLLYPLTGNAQQFSITGTVTDQTGEPVPGAGILIQGTTTGVTTDIDGVFSIEVTKGQTLEISCVGYKTATVPVGDRAILDIVLETDTTVLDDVVVVAYGVEKKVNLTGSVVSVSSKDIENIPVANTATLLQGRMPGVVLTSNGSVAGNDNPEIRIRGIGTFGTADPMLLVDGVETPLSQIANIPAQDIASISVLKDAASAAIYGVRAANGVILITTKRGSEGTPIKVNYSGSYTLQTPGIVPDYIDSYHWALMRNDVDPGRYDETALQKLLDGSDPDHYANTRWLDAVLRNASMHQHNLSVSGGNKNTKYMASINYQDQDGIVMSTGVERIGFRTNLDTRYKRFTFGLNLSGNRVTRETPGVSVQGSGDAASIMRYVEWFTHPTVPIKYSNGHYGYVDGSLLDPEMVSNPLEIINRGYRLNNSWRFDGKAYAGLDIVKGLKFQTSLAYTLSMSANKSYSPKALARYDAEGTELKAAGQENSLTESNSRTMQYINENILTYDNTFGKHTIGILLGHSIMGSKSYSVSAKNKGFATENIYELNGGTEGTVATGSSSEYALQSFFGRVKYNFDERYLFEFNLRHDGSSRMPKSDRYATFPSLSAAWIFSNEKFMEKSKDWFFGKLRFSWGKLGNQEIGNYAYTATLAPSGNYYFDQSGTIQAGMVQNSVPNEKIKWETTRTVNVGIDLGFLNNKISTTFEWYDKKTSGILMRLAMPDIFLGNLAAPYQNAGEVRNRGWDWAVNYQDMKGDWAWNAGFYISHVKNEILKMGNLDEVLGSNTINRVGYPINSYFGYKSLGIYKTQADVESRLSETGEIVKQNGQIPSPGDIIYEDTNNDGNITAEDRQIIGNPFPDFSYGFTIGVSWKNLDLTMLWQGVAGIYRYSVETTSDIRGNFTDRWYDRWSEENPDGKMPRLGNTFNNQYSSFWLEKADYLRLKNLEIGYNFRQRGLEKAGISSIRVYLSGTNLLTFTPMENWDPEKSSGDYNNNVSPSMRTYSIGLNISF